MLLQDSGIDLNTKNTLTTEQKLHVARAALGLIYDIGNDYDGCNPKNAVCMKELAEELVEIADIAFDILDQEDTK